MKYTRFFAMIGVSTIAMFIMMYLNTYALSHIWFSETRTYMALYMGAGMAVIMLAFMLSMYTDSRKNIAIFAGAVILFVACLYLLRSQLLVSDSAYMKGMIPHHSIAILTSERSQLEDQRVRELANGIIRTQRKEIKEMEWLIKDIEQNGKLTSGSEAAKRPVPNFEGKVDKGRDDE